MKLYKSLFVVAAIICGMMTSCSEDGFWDKATPADLGLTDGTSYAFNSKSISYVYYPADVLEGTDINITVTRGTTAGTATLPIKATFSDGEMLSGPESVTFAEGSSTASYPIHFNKEIEIGQSVSATLAIDSASIGIPRVNEPVFDGDSTEFKSDSIAYVNYLTKLANYKIVTKVNISKDYNWKSLGKGKWSDDYYFEVSGIDVEVKQAVENPSIFRVMLDYAAVAEEAGTSANGNQSAYTNITLLKKGDELMGAAITEDDLVYWTKINLGYASGGIDLIAMHPMDFSANWARYNNTSYVAAYQSNGLPAKIVLSGLILKEGTSSGWAPCQSNAPIATLVFPGVKIYDYSAEVSYVGLFTNPDGAITVWGDLTLGADAKTAKAVIISQDADPAAVADAIAAGDLEATDVAAGRIELPMPADANGKLQIVVAVIDEGEAKNVATAKFEYYSGENPWTDLGEGYFVDDVILPLFGYDPDVYKVKIAESTSTPGLYQLKAMYSAVAADFEIQSGTGDVLVHAEQPNGVYIPKQDLELQLGSNGPFFISTDAGELVEQYGFDLVMEKMPNIFGSINNGVITFPVLEEENSNGDKVPYQLWCILGAGDNGKHYFAGTNGKFTIVLPGASADVRAKAASRAKATDFAFRLKGGVMGAKKSVKNQKRAFLTKLMKSYK